MNLEDALQQEEEQVDALLKEAAKYLSALKAWKKACHVGHLGNRQKASAQASEQARLLSGPATEAASAWNFDVRAYLEGAPWRQELQAAAAEKYGLRVLEEEETLVSSPVVVRSQPGRGVLQLGRVNWPAIRPRVVAAELKRLRDRTAAANSQEFVESLFAVWEHISRDSGVFAKFRDVYDLFCLTPGWKKENPPAAFGQAIYALHRSGVQATRGGRTFEFVYPSGNYRERDVFPVISEDGRPIRYYGIRFR
jgi:hypothetical protein